MPTPEQHALLSASSSHRWLHCPPSARLAAQFPSKTSSYAEAGRLAHAIAELKARKCFLEPMSTRSYNSRLKKLQADEHYDKEMDASTDTYLEFLKETAMGFEQTPFVALETRVDFSEYVPEGFGTADCIMIGGQRIVVVDYKNGSGVPVAAERNSQMMLYGIGAIRTYAPIFGDSITDVLLAIVQPNAGGVKTWETTVAELRAWGENVVTPIAKAAHAGTGDFCAGDWCDDNFCPAKAQCSARAAHMLGLEPMKGAEPAGRDQTRLWEWNPPADKPLLTDAEIGEVLQRAYSISEWVKALEEYALEASLAGRTVAGFKVVEGRGSRAWTDTDAAFAALRERGIEESLLYERKPVTPPALEKALGKETFAEASEGLVVKKPGKPTLVPDSDPRKPYNAAAVAFGAADA